MTDTEHPLTRDHTARFHDHSWEQRLMESPSDYLTTVHARIEKFAEPNHHDNYRSCWPWQGYVMPNGYGTLSINGKHRLAHRVIWLMWVDAIPDGHVVDHLCGRRDCVNVMHLDPVPPLENTRRALPQIRAAMAARRRTHCSQGHRFTRATSYTGSDGARRCVICRRDRALRRASVMRERVAEHGLPPSVPHGLPGYGLGCRCSDCRMAKRDVNAITHARRRRQAARQGVLFDTLGRVSAPNAGQFGAAR